MRGSPLGTVVSFYSYKGGVGRTMAVVNVAMALAQNGFRVMVVDLDLLAPGVQQYPPFREAVESSIKYVPPEARDLGHGGMLDLIDRQLWSHVPDQSPFSEQVRPSDKDKKTWKKWTRSVEWTRRVDRHTSGGCVDIMPAGPADHRALGGLAQIGWYRFLTEFKGFELMLRMRDQWWRADYDFTLIDSRTGLSDYLQFCVGILPDVSVVIAGLNEQNVEGFHAVTGSIKEVLQSRESDLFIIPVLSLIPSGELDKVRERLQKGEESLDSDPQVGNRALRFLTREPVKLPYVATLAVAERLVVPDDYHAPIFREYVRIAEMLARHKFAAIDNLLEEAIYESAAKGLFDPYVVANLKRALEDSETENYTYGRIKSESYEARRLALASTQEGRADSLESFKRAIALIRQRRHLSESAKWGTDTGFGHWKVELDTLVFYARVLAQKVSDSNEQSVRDEQNDTDEAVEAFTDALDFIIAFEKRNYTDIFSDRDWDRYSQELLFTRAFCLLSRLEAQLKAQCRGAVFEKSSLQADLGKTQALFDLLMPTGINPALKERLTKCANAIESLP